MPFSLPNLQQLNPADARLCLDTAKVLQEYHVGGSMLLAISAGAYSTALALVAAIMAPRLDLGLSAMHIDHGLRAESPEDAAFVAQLCASLHIPCEIARLDTRQIAAVRRCGLEEAGRIGRHAMLEEHRQKIGADCILLAHHRQDLCEDILMRLLRGAAWPAIAGMKRKDGRILRTFLYMAPQRLRDFLNSCSCPWREDASNASLMFLRNRLRHTVLPLLERENPSLGRNAANLRRLADVDQEFWDGYIAEALKKNPWLEDDSSGILSVTLSGELLAKLPRAARLRVYHLAMRRLNQRAFGNNLAQARTETLFSLDAAHSCGEGGRIFEFCGGIKARTSHKNVIFQTTKIFIEGKNNGSI